MRFDTKSVLLAALAAGVNASPYPAGGSYCKSKCSPRQIDDAFHAPSYLSDTKDWCRKYMRLPATTYITKTKTDYMTICDTKTKTATTTAYPVTVTETSTKYATSTSEDISVVTQTDTTTETSTYTQLVTTTNSVTKTELTTEIVYATDSTTVTQTDTKTKTDTVTATYYTTQLKPKPYYKPYQKRDDYKYDTSHKIPSYLPYDLSPHQIGSACWKINPCVTSTIIVYATATVSCYKPKIEYTTVTVTPTASATTTIYQTNVIITTILSTDTEVVTETSTVTTDVTETATEKTTETSIDTVTKVVATDVITSTVEEKTFTTTTVAKTITTTVFCLPKGHSCEPYKQPECCSGKCKASGYSYGKQTFTCY